MAGTLTILKQSITELAVDCVVNAANNQLKQGSGVCGAIFSAAGARELQQACDAIGGCPTGHAVITPGFRLAAGYIIHAVGPRWQGGQYHEADQLNNCYFTALSLARHYGCHSIAFPLISAGVYGYPAEQAWEIAIGAILDFQKTYDYPLDVYIAVIDDGALQMGSRILAQRTAEDKFRFFWLEDGEYGIFSQWYPSPFCIEGIRYANAEQYVMAKKALLFGDLECYSRIIAEADPRKCKALGRLVRNFDVKTWDLRKEEIAYNANLAKFLQNSQAFHMLLHTGNRILAKASPTDAIWGIGLEAGHPDSMNPEKWPGRNLLGNILMRVREECRSHTL